MPIRDHLDFHFHHFNAGELVRCARSLRSFLDDGGRLMVTLAGALSTAGLGTILSPAIREGIVDAICVTGANLEEDLFALLGRHLYEPRPDWRVGTIDDDVDLLSRGLNRITDVAIPEDVIRQAEEAMLSQIKKLHLGARPVDVLGGVATTAAVEAEDRRDDSWLLAAAERGTALFCPGFEDSTLGGIAAARIIDGTLPSDALASGLDELAALADWYRFDPRPAGVLQVGGGIAGDFALSVVPMLRQDLGEDAPLWEWYAQISESRPSYGGYSGAPPSEKVSWEKLAPRSPMFVIESDATIVLPLLLAHVLDL